MPLPFTPSFSPINLAMVSPPEATPPISPTADKLVEASDVVNDSDGPNVSSISRELDAVGDALDATQTNVTPAVTITNATITAVEQTGVATDIEEEIVRFSDGIPALLIALNKVKKLHPFIEVVVLAFDTVYTLEQKRRENDKKAIALYVGMKDMMRVLLLLEDVETDEEVSPDGRSIHNQLKLLVERTADDIVRCSNVCDAYMKERILAKVLLGHVWDEKLLEFVTLFAQRRRDLQFELTIHINQGLYKANSRPSDIAYGVNDLDEKIKSIFPQLARSEEKRLLDHVQANGGAKAFRDDNKKLYDLESMIVSAAPSARADDGRTYREMYQRIFEDPNAAADKNWDTFSRKFEAQKNQIIQGISRAVERESDRVIEGLKSGAHERIRDQAIYDTWVDMGWRGSSVKARHFVLALRDHYLDKSSSEIPGMAPRGVDISLNSDAWAIKSIDLTWLQPISEAFNDDASGFITIAEINRFTSSRPADWSLPQWLAFWAVGFRSSIIDYARKIEDLFTKMEGIRTEVLPANREFIDFYFTYVWKQVRKLTAAVPSPIYFPFDSKFKSYTEAEETRLSANLKAVKYIIDGTDSLSLITGVGRIEKTVFPLLYLLMKRHYEIMQIMRTKILQPREIWDSVDSIWRVHDAVNYRVYELTNNFSRLRMDPEKEFQNFAYGIFKYFWYPLPLNFQHRVQSLSHPVTLYESDKEVENVEPKDILNYSYKNDQVLYDWVYDGHTIDDMPNYGDAESPLEDILGHWHGYYYDREGVNWTDDPMMTILLEPREDERGFGGKAWHCQGCSDIKWSWSKDESNIIEVKLEIFLSDTYIMIPVKPLHLKGRFYPDRDALTGVWAWDSSGLELESARKMEFRRIPPVHFTGYPSIRDLTDNKPRALWKFAIAAVRNEIRRENWSWSHFSQRRLDRITRVSLTIRYTYFGIPLNKEEVDQLNAVTKRLTSADACFYGSIVNQTRANTWTHIIVYCDSCDGMISGARLFCLDCVYNLKPMVAFHTVDFCCEPRCVAARIQPLQVDLKVAHEPNHRLIKARIPVLLRDYGRICSTAHWAFERIRHPCMMIAESTGHPQEEEKTGLVGPETPNRGPTFAEIPANADKVDDALTTPREERTGPDKQETPNHELTVAEISAGVDRVDNVPTAPPEEEKTGSVGQETLNHEPTFADMPINVDKVDDVPTAQDGHRYGSGDGGEAKDSASQHSTEVPIQNENLPTCGNCKGRLSFPCWYCILCEDDLFICAACDRAGVPKLMRSSGEHTEGHLLIRCQGPQIGGPTFSPTEQPLPMEGRLNGMQIQLDDLSRRMGDHSDPMGDLNGRVGGMANLVGELTGSITSLTSRIADIELLLNRLAGTANGSL